MQGGLVQYLIAAGVTDVFTQPTPAVQNYIAEHLRIVCNRPGPYCGGSGGGSDGDDGPGRGPIAAVHVRQGDSCDGRKAAAVGPFNAMFVTNPTTGKALKKRLATIWGCLGALSWAWRGGNGTKKIPNISRSF